MTVGYKENYWLILSKILENYGLIPYAIRNLKKLFVGIMGSKQREIIKLKSTESTEVYWTTKNKKNDRCIVT